MLQFWDCCSFGVLQFWVAAVLGVLQFWGVSCRSAQRVPCRVLESRMGDVERQMLAEGPSLLLLVQEFIGKPKWLETSGADTVRTLRHLVIGLKIL